MTQSDERPDEESVPTEPVRPSAPDDRNLVRLMLAGRQEQTFYLQEGWGEDDKPIYSTEYYVTARQWTGVQRDQYNAVGSTLTMPFEAPIGARGSRDAPSMSRMQVTPDPVERLRKLVELTVIGYCLAPGGSKVDKPRVGEFKRQDWLVFAALPPAVLDAIRDDLHDFLGIEMIDEGEASEPGS